MVVTIDAEGGQALSIEIDSAGPRVIPAIVVKVAERFGSIDAVVIDARIIRVGIVDAARVYQ